MMLILAQAVANPQPTMVAFGRGPILLLGCGGAVALFVVVAIVVVLMASGRPREDR